MNEYTQIRVIEQIARAQVAVNKRYGKWDTPLELDEFLAIATALNEAKDLLKKDLLSRIK